MKNTLGGHADITPWAESFDIGLCLVKVVCTMYVCISMLLVLHTTLLYLPSLSKETINIQFNSGTYALGNSILSFTEFLSMFECKDSRKILLL